MLHPLRRYSGNPATDSQKWREQAGGELRDSAVRHHSPVRICLQNYGFCYGHHHGQWHPRIYCSVYYFLFMLGVIMVAAPGVPGGAIMAATGILSTMLGFGDADIALMIATYIALDSFGTATNVTGDGAIAIAIDKIAGRSLDESAKTESHQGLNRASLLTETSTWLRSRTKRSRQQVLAYCGCHRILPSCIVLLTGTTSTDSSSVLPVKPRTILVMAEPIGAISKSVTSCVDLGRRRASPTR